MRYIQVIFKNIICVSALLSAFSFAVKAQVLNDIQNSFNAYRQNALQEKVFVHTDKEAYLTGEIIWFKIYVVDGTQNKPLNLSKIAYVDILDNNQVPVMQAKIALHNGSGSGSLYIPVSAENGNYKFRSYTSWMKNFGADHFFEKKITIVNPAKSPGAMAKQSKAYDIQFFPEGGNLVSGLASKVAFKAVGRDGKGVDVTGAILNQKNDTIARFKSLKFGMGHFSFTPNADDTYKAIVRANNDNPVTKDLPAVNKQGYVMQIAGGGANQLDVTVSSNAGSSDGQVYLFAHTRQVIKLAKNAVLNNGVAHFSVDKSILGDGISHLTVFNGDKQPVCERLYFKRPTQKMMINASADQQQYTNRKKVSVAIAANDQASKPLNADLSVAVYHLDDYQTAPEGDIASYFWLGSDLKGYIESPDYYFNNTTAEADEAADNLMLTQGWSRFVWSDVLKNKQPSFAFLPEYDGHIVSGKIVTADSNTPARDVVTYFGVPGKRVQLFTSRSDSTGRILFNTKDFYGPGEIVVQTNTLRDSAFRIDILTPFSEQYTKNPLPPFTVTGGMQSALEAQYVDMQVLNIYAGNKIKRFYDAGIDSTAAFYGKPDKVYKLDDYTRFTTMEEVLREYIREIFLSLSRKRYHIKVITDRGLLEGDPLVMLDGIPIFDINKVVAIDPLKVRKLEVIRDRYFWESADAEGILSYTTYKGDLGGVELDPHAVVVDYEGIQLQRVFYSPAYETVDAAASRLPDFRNVLYWSPSVTTGTQGKNQVSFYTSDQEGKYIGVVQGITANGEAGSHYFTFEVKK